MLKPSEAGFRRLLPLLRPHLRQLSLGLVCMVVIAGLCLYTAYRIIQVYDIHSEYQPFFTADKN